jgi:hypothetical protein
LFAIQSELAQSIAAQLKAKLSPQQKAEIEERPTQDLDAFEFYLQAKSIVDSYINATDVRAALLQALKSLSEAIKRDPNFVSAYCYSARANDLLFFFDLDPRPIASLWPTLRSMLRCDSVPIRRRPISPGLIISSGVFATTIARWKNLPLPGRVCRTAARFSFSPVTSIGGAITSRKRSEISRPPSPSIHGIPMRTTFLRTLMCSNAASLTPYTFTIMSSRPAKTFQSSGFGGQPPFCTEPATPVHCAMF